MDRQLATKSQQSQNLNSSSSSSTSSLLTTPSLSQVSSLHEFSVGVESFTKATKALAIYQRQLTDYLSQLAEKPKDFNLNPKGVFSHVLTCSQEMIISNDARRSSDAVMKQTIDYVNGLADANKLGEFLFETESRYQLDVLHYCATSDQLAPLYTALIERGFAPSTKGIYPSHLAVLMNQEGALRAALTDKELHTVELTLLSGAENSENHRIHFNELYLAIVSGKLNLIKTLFDVLESFRRVAKDLPNKSEGNWLHLAATLPDSPENTNIEIFDYLLNKRYLSEISLIALLNESNAQGLTPLGVAAYLGHKMLVNHIMILCTQHLQYQQRQPLVSEAFYAAAFNGQARMVSLLIDGYGFIPSSAQHQRYDDLIYFLQGIRNNPMIADKIKGNYQLIQTSIKKANQAERLHGHTMMLNQQPYDTLVFQGGGMKGAIFPYAIEYFHASCEIRAQAPYYTIDKQKQLHWQHIKRVAGTSAGAIVALAYAIGYTPAELAQEMRLNFGDFIENDEVAQRIEDNASLQETLMTVFKTLFEIDLAGPLADLQRHIETYSKAGQLGKIVEAGKIAYEYLPQAKMIYEKLLGLVEKIKGFNQDFDGFSSGERVRTWLCQLLTKKGLSPDLTFGELAHLIKPDSPYKHLHVIITNLETNQPETITSENLTSGAHVHANYLIVDAVRASMSLPLIFKPHQLRIKVAHQIAILPATYIDGGLIHNYGILDFDIKGYSNPESAGYLDYPTGLNKRVLGFRFKMTPLPQEKPRTVMEYIKHLGLIFYNAEEVVNAGKDYGRSIVLDTGAITTYTFKTLADAQLQILRQQALQVVSHYFGQEQSIVEATALQLAQQLNLLVQTEQSPVPSPRGKGPGMFQSPPCVDTNTAVQPTNIPVLGRHEGNV